MKPGQFLFERIFLRALVEDEGESSPAHHCPFSFYQQTEASMSVLLTKGGSAIPGGIWLLLLKILLLFLLFDFDGLFYPVGSHRCTIITITVTITTLHQPFFSILFLLSNPNSCTTHSPSANPIAAVFASTLLHIQEGGNV